LTAYFEALAALETGAAPQPVQDPAPTPEAEADLDPEEVSQDPTRPKQQRIRPRSEQDAKFFELYRSNPDKPLAELLAEAGLAQAPAGHDPAPQPADDAQALPGSYAELDAQIGDLWEQHRSAIADDLDIDRGLEIADQIRELEKQRLTVRERETEAQERTLEAWRAEEVRLTPEFPLILERTDTVHHELAMSRIQAIKALDPKMASDPRVIEQVCRAVYDALGESARKVAPGVIPASTKPPAVNPPPSEPKAPLPGGPRTSGAVVQPGSSSQTLANQTLPVRGKLDAYEAKLAALGIRS
jgi:hypothetical protein